MKQPSDKAKILLAIEHDKQEQRKKIETVCIWMGWILLTAAFFLMFVISIAIDPELA